MGVKGQFFSLDACLALSLFVIASILLFSFFSVKAPLTQQYYYVDDVNNLFSNIKIDDIMVKNSFVNDYSDGNYNNIKAAQDYDSQLTLNEIIRNMQVYQST